MACRRPPCTAREGWAVSTSPCPVPFLSKTVSPVLHLPSHRRQDVPTALFVAAYRTPTGPGAGYKNGILRTEDYTNIAQCDSLEDMKLHLAGTDYGNFLQNESLLSSKVITERALDRLVNEFLELRAGHGFTSVSLNAFAAMPINLLTESELPVSWMGSPSVLRSAVGGVLTTLGGRGVGTTPLLLDIGRGCPDSLPWQFPKC